MKKTITCKSRTLYGSLLSNFTRTTIQILIITHSLSLLLLLRYSKPYQAIHDCKLKKPLSDDLYVLCQLSTVVVTTGNSAGIVVDITRRVSIMNANQTFHKPRDVIMGGHIKNDCTFLVPCVMTAKRSTVASLSKTFYAIIFCYYIQ